MLAGWQSMTHALLGACMRAFSGPPIVLRPGTEWHQEITRDKGAIFRAQHSQVDLGEGSISTTDPELDVRLADVVGPPLKEGDWVDVAGVRYRIADPQPDGEGGCKFKLVRKNA